MCIILCVSFYVYHFMCIILCVSFYMYHFMCNILCVSFYVYHFMCIILYVSFYMYHFMCIIFYVSFYVYHFICIILCVSFYVYHFMCIILCVIFYVYHFMSIKKTTTLMCIIYVLSLCALTSIKWPLHSAFTSIKWNLRFHLIEVIHGLGLSWCARYTSMMYMNFDVCHSYTSFMYIIEVYRAHQERPSPRWSFFTNPYRSLFPCPYRSLFTHLSYIAHIKRDQVSCAGLLWCVSVRGIFDVYHTHSKRPSLIWSLFMNPYRSVCTYLYRLPCGMWPTL